MTIWISCGPYPSWIRVHYHEPCWIEEQWKGYELCWPSVETCRLVFSKLPLPGEMFEVEMKVKETWVME